MINGAGGEETWSWEKSGLQEIEKLVTTGKFQQRTVMWL